MALTKIPGFGIDTSSFALANANITGNLTAGNANLGNLVIANYFSGNGSLLTGISTAVTSNGNSNLSIPSSNGNVTISAVGNANIVVITGTGVNVNGTLNSTGNLTAANANLGNVVTANYTTAVLTTGNQPNISNVGTLGNLSVTSNITAGNINAGNLLTANYTNAVLTTANQPNITNVGTLGNLSVTSNIVAGNIGNATTILYGNGYNLTGLDAAGRVVNGTSNLSIASSGGNITMGVAGNAGIVTVTGTGANISGYANISGNLTAGNLSLTGNVTSTLNVTGNANVGNLNTAGSVTASNLTLTGNLVVGGTTTYVNSTTTAIVDPIVEQGGGANNAALTTNDNKDRGTTLHYYTTTPVDAFMGWKNANSEFIFASNASVTSDIVIVNTLGNVRANYFIGNGSQLTGIAATTAVSLINGTSNVVVTNSGNVTFGVGGNASILAVTSTGANFGGYVSALGNITSQGNVSASYFIGNGSQLTGVGLLSNGTSNICIPATNGNLIFSVAGQYAIMQITSTGTNAAGYLNVTGALTAPNITTTGFANIQGTLTTANANLGNLATANYFNGTLTTLSSSQPNIQTVGTLNYLNVSNANSGNGNINANVITASYLRGDGSNLTGIGGAGYIYNANSNVAIPSANSNIYFTVGATSNVVVVSTGGINANGYANFTGNVLAGNIYANSGIVKGQYLYGDGSNLTGLGGAGYIFNGNSNVFIPSANSNVYFTIGTTSNVVTVSTGGINANGYANFTGTVSAGNASITSNLTSGNANLGNLATSNYFSGKFDSLSGSQPNITSLGTLLNVTVTANANIGGNVFIGNSSSNVLVANTGAIIATGNITAPNANLGNLVTANYTNAVLTTAAQPNITSIGTLGNLTVTNNVSANVITTGSGTNGNLVIDPDGTGNLIISNTTPVVMSNTLTSNGNVAFTGANISLGPAGNVKITGGSTNQYLKTDGSGNLSWGTPSGGGGGGGTALTYTAAATPPGSANIADQWYNTSSNTLYEYISDGTSSYWIDIQTPTVSSGTVTVTGGANLLVQSQGSNLVATANTINFTGNGISATNSGNVVTVTVTTPTTTTGTTRAVAMTMGILFGG